MKDWKKISSETVYENPWYSVRKDQVIGPDSKPREYNVVIKPAAVFIVAMDEQDRICFVDLERYPTGTLSREIPAGSGDGQQATTAAKRELQEETGFTAEHWEDIGGVECANGYSNETGHVFICKGLAQTGENEQTEEGITSVTFLHWNEIFEQIRSGKIVDSQTLASLLLASIHLGIKQ